MRVDIRAGKHRGGVLPLVTVCLVSLVGFIALAVDLGMLMVARNHCQNAADAAALAGVRSVNGDSTVSFGRANVAPNAIRAATENPVLDGHITGDPASHAEVSTDRFVSEDVTVELGSYTYFYDPSNAANDGFRLRFPRTNATEPYGAVRSTVTYDSGKYFFAKVFGLNGFSRGAHAVAVHRPRDIVIIMDLSGSMRFQSLPGIPMSGSSANPSASGTARSRSMNPDPAFPKFGHYSATDGSGNYLADLQGTTSVSTGTEYVDPSNISVSSSSGPPIADYWYTNKNATTKAFTKASSAFATAPGGDNYLKESSDTGTNYAKTVRDVFGTGSNRTDAAFELSGYDASSLGRATTFQGYTYGPSYWGKTFFIWPPDPREATAGDPTPSNYANNGAKDWRQRFFIKSPLQPSFTGRVERTPTNDSASYAVGYSGWMRIRSLPSSQPPEIGDVVTIRNDTSRLYTVTDVRNSTWSGEGSSSTIKEIKLHRSLQTAVADTNNVQIQFRQLGWLDENRLLFDSSSGGVEAAGPWSQGNSLSNVVEVGNVDYFYRINYAAIVKWLKSTGTNPFPTSLRAGRIIYYTAMPDETDSGLNARLWSGDWTGIADDTRRNERFWRDYIDFVLGVQWREYRYTSSYGTRFESYTRYNFNSSGYPYLTQMIGNGGPFTWGSYQISARPTFASTSSYLNGRVNGNHGAGATTISAKNLSSAPRAGDLLYFSNDSSRVYEVAASPTPTSTSFKLTEPLDVSTSNNTNYYFKQVGYMDYNDNPRRFRHQYWFGPQTMIDYLGNYNTQKFWWPGTVPEAQSWACKMGIQVAMEDIKHNHPNDYVGLVFFSSPDRKSGSSLSEGKHNRARVAMRSIAHGDQYKRLINALWYPPTVVEGDVEEIWYDNPDMLQVPRAEGGTCPIMGFMLAYNQFSASTNTSDLRYYAKGSDSSNFYDAQNGIVGGFGRKGAQKMVIFETDGAPNTGANATFVKKGSSTDNQSYYPVRIYDTAAGVSETKNEYPNAPGYDVDDLYGVVQTLVNLDDHTSKPGHSTSRRPALIHSIAYGTLYDPSNSGSSQSSALDVLQQIQVYGNTATNSSGSTFPTYKRIYGSVDDRIEKMQEAFTIIMQEGVSVSLLQ